MRIGGFTRYNILFYTRLYLAALGTFFAIDMLWLGLIARPFYQAHLGYILAPETNWLAAAVFYLLFLAGVLVFVVVPGLQAGSLRAVLLRGAFFGLITYATYDLTNLATLKDWPLLLSLVDMTWGTFLSAAVSLASYLAGRRMAAWR